jgi:putative endonuclease
MKKYNYSKGRIAEGMAKKYLEAKNYIWIESNYTNEIGEIDIVMSDKDWLVFVEVKYKADDTKGLPEEMINRVKVSQVKRVAELFILTNKILKTKFSKYRIDAVCILGEKINHYQNIQ